MKISFQGFKDPSTLPLLKVTVFRGKELEEVRERMRKWLRKRRIT